MRRRRVSIIGLVAVVLATGCTGPPGRIRSDIASGSTAPAIQQDPDGLGDPYFPKAGNRGYDVTHYVLDVTYDPATDALTGTATITATATAALDRFNLDFTGLTAQGVTVDGAPATTTHLGGELVVTPPTTLAEDGVFEVVVRYSGVPQAYVEAGLGEIGFLHTADGAIALGEPQVAASWYPVNDHPRDKATYTIKITTPDPLEALSNGILQSKTTNAGWTTWTWSVSKPMAPYLATAVIGEYRVTESTHDGLPVILAVHSSLPTEIDDQLRRTPEVLDFLETRFGPYPFDALGGIVINDERIRFALENQTRPVYSQAFYEAGRDASSVIAHELAHQWYGDSVSVEDWSEIWLNEGFATYAQWLWSEHQGQETAQAMFDRVYGQRGDLWRVPPGDPGRDDLFHPSVYLRGAMTLHAVRVTVGDGAFFRILPTWAAEQADGSATTEEFIGLAERISGRQLDRLFQDWLYGTVRPARP